MAMKLLFVSLTMATIAVAQPPQGGGKRGQRGQKGQGPGQGQRNQEKKGPGNISIAAYGFNGLGIVRLLEVPEVQTDLKLTTDDLSQLPLLRQEFTENDAKYSKALTDAAAQGGDALRLAIVTRSKEIDGQMKELLGTKFTRFQQVRRQAFGVLASFTSDAVVRENVAITDDQKAKLNVDLARALERFPIPEINPLDRTASPDDLDLGMQGYRGEEQKILMKILTDTQSAKWKTLVGSPMVIPQEVDRFIRRGDFGPRNAVDQPIGGFARTKGMKGGKRQRGDRPPAEGSEKKPPL